MEEVENGPKNQEQKKPAKSKFTWTNTGQVVLNKIPPKPKRYASNITVSVTEKNSSLGKEKAISSNYDCCMSESDDPDEKHLNNEIKIQMKAIAKF